MELVCARHGRTAWNAVRRFQGQTDIPLDDEGQAQAQALAAHLRPERFDLAVSSDLTRARTTAEAIVSGRVGLTLELDPALREMRFGAWEGLTWAEIVERWPELSEKYEYSPRNYVPEGGEGWDALCERIEAAMRRVTARLAPDGRALIVSHAGVMHAILHVVGSANGENGDLAVRVRLAPASVLRVRGSFEDGWTIDAINETAAPLRTTA
jgi:broad specificity phosphatase PhoE